MVTLMITLRSYIHDRYLFFKIAFQTRTTARGILFVRAFADVEERDRPVSVLIGCDRPKIKIDKIKRLKYSISHGNSHGNSPGTRLVSA